MTDPHECAPVFSTVEQAGDFTGLEIGKLWVLDGHRVYWIGLGSVAVCQDACRRLSALDPAAAREFTRRVWNEDGDFDALLRDL